MDAWSLPLVVVATSHGRAVFHCTIFSASERSKRALCFQKYGIGSVVSFFYFCNIVFLNQFMVPEAVRLFWRTTGTSDVCGGVTNYKFFQSFHSQLGFMLEYSMYRGCMQSTPKFVQRSQSHSLLDWSTTSTEDVYLVLQGLSTSYSLPGSMLKYNWYSRCIQSAKRYLKGPHSTWGYTFVQQVQPMCTECDTGLPEHPLSLTWTI